MGSSGESVGVKGDTVLVCFSHLVHFAMRHLIELRRCDRQVKTAKETKG